MRRRRVGPGTVALRATLVAGAALFLVPIYLLVNISLKTPSGLAAQPYAPAIPAHTANYSEAWHGTSGTGTASLSGALVNSLVITGGSVLLLVIIGSLCGYVLGRRTSRLSTIAYISLLIGITVPAQLAIIPLYRQMSDMGLAGTRHGMVLLYVGLLTPFTVFLYTGFVRALPRDFEEASRMDGASELRTFVKVVFPLLRPITATVAVLDAVATWNDFFGQLIFLNGSGKETLPVTVFSLAGRYVSNYPALSAGLVLALLPIMAFYLLLQRRIIAGFSSGLKG